MKYIVKHKTVVGRRNYEDGKGNQDSIKIYENNEVIVVCVNDGATGCDYPQKACEINSEVAVSIGREPAIFEVQEKKFKQLVNDSYMELFDKANVPIEELSATTAFIVIKKATGQYIAFSVGDTAILTYNSDMRISMLLAPKNGITKSFTQFTNDSKAILKYSQFKRGIIDDLYAGFIIYSDGAEDISLNTNSSANPASRLIRACYTSDEAYAKEEESVFNSLKKLTRDDISIAIIASANEKLINKVNKKSNEEVHIETKTESGSEDIMIDIPTDTDDCMIYTPKKDSLGDTRRFTVPVKKKAVTEAHDVMSSDRVTVAENTESSLLRFMKVSRTVDEIVDSGIVSEKDVLQTLIILFKIGAITCVNNKFRAR